MFDKPMTPPEHPLHPILKAKLIAVSDPKALAEAAAARVLASIAANDGLVAICMSGGSSPKQLYQLLGTDLWRERIPWQRVHWFIGDERLVPSNHPLNNMAMARQALLDRCAPAGNIHPIPTDADDAHQAARRYEAELKSFYGADRLDPARPLFDIVLLGMGPDGHTASLFPGGAAIEDTERWVVGIDHAPVEPMVPRVTLSLQALSSCRDMLFEVAGREKHATLARVLAGERLPASRAHAIGETVWLVDRAALAEDFSDS
jgi:6-phosphogluconolactonase